MYPVIPIRLDLFAVFIFLGVIQGFLLCFFFLTKKNGAITSNRLQGLILFALAAHNLEIFLCYSKYIVKVIHLVDFSEPFNFFIGPVFYLYILSKTSDKFRFNFRYSLHLLPFILYVLYAVLFYIQTPEFKYNAFLSAYHPGMSHIPRIRIINPDPLFIKKYINELALLQVFIYVGMSLFIIYKAFKKENLSFFSNANKVLTWLRGFSLIILVYVLTWLFVKIRFAEDLGDHFTASFISIIIYSISFSVIKKSYFFSERTFSQAKKYKKSSLTRDMKDQILKRLQEVMEKEKFYLDNSFSLPALAKMLHVPVHHLSQVLNDCLQKNFFEYIGTYRISEAQKILSNPANANLMIEEIAERVGYNSKSAFNSAFKKHTGLTPSQFREQQTKKDKSSSL